MTTKLPHLHLVETKRLMMKYIIIILKYNRDFTSTRILLVLEVEDININIRWVKMYFIISRLVSTKCRWSNLVVIDYISLG